LLPAGTACRAAAPGNSARDGHPRRLVRLRRVPRRGGRAAAATRLPADLYLEGSDQHRGCSIPACLPQSAPAHCAVQGGAHPRLRPRPGGPADVEIGRNVVAPEEVIKKFGAEILRLWVATQDYRNDTRVGDQILQQVSEAYRRIRNTARYILGNLHDFDPTTGTVPHAELLAIDRWALSKLGGLTERVLKAYDDYEFHVLYHACTTSAPWR